MKILVAENSIRIREALATCLSEFGEVITCHSGNSAIQKITEEGVPDVVFTDYHMADGTGLDLIDYINDKTLGIPIVLITAYGSKDLTIKALNKRVFSFIEKPVELNDIKEVMSKISEHLSKTQADEKIKKLGLLSDVILHEVGGPLQELLFDIHNLPQTSIETDESSEISSSLQRLRKDVEELSITFSNLKTLLIKESIKIEDMRPINLNNLAEELTTWTQQFYSNPKLQIKSQLPNNIIQVRGDESLLKRALKNIVVNAIEALTTSSNSGLMEIKLDTENNHPSIQVKNTGPQIAPNDLEKIFDHRFTTKDSKGHGIGLHLTKKIIQAHGATIEVESRPSLTSFTIRFEGSQPQ